MDNNTSEKIMQESIQQKNFIEQIRTMQHAVHSLAVEKGWYESDQHIGVHLANIHGEVSKLNEAMRDRVRGKSEKIPDFTRAEEAAADIVLRLLDTCEYMGWRLGQAIIAKHEFNKTRPYRHGGKLF